jgi:hypothetical protein
MRFQERKSSRRWGFFSLDGKQRGETRSTKYELMCALACGRLGIPKRIKVGTVRQVRS